MRGCLTLVRMAGRVVSAPFRWARFERELASRVSGRH